MARPDLLALTDDGLIQLANAGLVKRALRELADGTAPAITEAPDGVIEARFADGTVTRLAVGQALGNATCSCPASGMCRHRIGLVITYRHHNQTQHPAVPNWDPGTLDLAALESALPALARTELARLRSQPLHVRLVRGATPSAGLPMATVRFLAPNDPRYARCDCAAGQGCVHIVLAVEAFRSSGGIAEVTIGSSAVTPNADNLRSASDAVLARLLAEGAAAGLAAHGPLIDHARAIAEKHGATWQVLALEALAAQIGAYEQRSALYDEAEVINLATELYARPRATSSAALGLGEAMETAMAKTRLVSLGARVVARGRDLQASVALFDTDTGTTVLVEKGFVPPDPQERLNPKDILARPMVTGLPLNGLARGQVLTSVVHRRADGTVRFGGGARGKTTLMARGVRVEPPAPLRVTSLPALTADLAARPPVFLQPRNRVANLHVFDVEAVVGQIFEPGSQMWRAAVTLPDGGQLTLQRRYDRGAPAAVDTLTAAFSGGHGTLRHLAGHVWLEDGEVVCDPWSVTADTFIVPDCDSPATAATQPSLSQTSESADGPHAAHLFLATALHAGARRRDSDFMRRGRELVRDLESAGFATTGARLSDWLSASHDDVQAFGRVATWLSVLLSN